MPICLRADAHIMHGSTVTYRVVSANGYFGIGWGVRVGSCRIASMASSSACRVACGVWYQPPLSPGSENTRTFRSSFVRFRAAAMILPSRTNTHPTGTSPALSASSAFRWYGAQSEERDKNLRLKQTMFIASHIQQRCSSLKSELMRLAIMGNQNLCPKKQEMEAAAPIQ
jgi:hypothetical protein